MMNKTRTTLLAALAVVATVNTGFAAESTESSVLSIAGEATLKWERSNPTGSPDSHTGEQTLKLNFSQPLSEKVSLYGRFAYRNFSGNITHDSIHELDQYGLIYKAGTNTLTLGSQEVTLGTLSGLVDLTEVGRDFMFRGANWTSEAEECKLRLLAGRVDKNALSIVNDKDATVTGIEASKAFAGVTFTGEYLHINKQLANQADFNSVYGVGAKYGIDKWEFSMEGLRSSAKQDKYGLLAGATYSVADNESISATYRNLKANSVITGLATYDAGTKGVELAWEKSLSERLSVTLSHEWTKDLATQERDRIASLEATYTF